MTRLAPDLVFEPRSRLLQIWAVAFLVVGFTIGWGLARSRVLTRGEAATLAKILSIRQDLSAHRGALGRPIAASFTDATTSAIGWGLDYDWNLDFDELERITEGQLRQLELTAGASAVTARLEFRVRSLTHAAGISTVLNSQKTGHLWSLEKTSAHEGWQLGEGQQFFAATWTRKSRIQK